MGKVNKKPKYDEKAETLTLSLRTTKNKTCPLRETDVVISTNPGNFGVLQHLELAAMGKQYDVFTKQDGTSLNGAKGAPSWFFDGAKIDQGEAKVATALLLDRDLRERVSEALDEVFNAEAETAVGQIGEEYVPTDEDAA